MTRRLLTATDIRQAERVTTFVLRDAAPTDMAALRAVFRRSSLSNEDDRSHLLAHPEALELADAAVLQGRTRVAVTDGRVVGFASWLGDEDAVEIEDLFVDPDWMRRGVGRALVLDLIALARGRGARRAGVTANENARAFYENVGFVVGREVDTTFGPALQMYQHIAV
jgi:GNAT superfamily N-acetyltransferase